MIDYVCFDGGDSFMGRLALILYLPLGVLGAVFAKLRPALTLSTGLAFQTSVGFATRPARDL